MKEDKLKMFSEEAYFSHIDFTNMSVLDVTVR